MVCLLFLCVYIYTYTYTPIEFYIYFLFVYVPMKIFLFNLLCLLAVYWVLQVYPTNTTTAPGIRQCEEVHKPLRENIQLRMQRHCLAFADAVPVGRKIAGQQPPPKRFERFHD